MQVLFLYNFRKPALNAKNNFLKVKVFMNKVFGFVQFRAVQIKTKFNRCF